MFSEHSLGCPFGMVFLILPAPLCLLLFMHQMRLLQLACCFLATQCPGMKSLMVPVILVAFAFIDVSFSLHSTSKLIFILFQNNPKWQLFCAFLQWVGFNWFPGSVQFLGTNKSTPWTGGTKGKKVNNVSWAVWESAENNYVSHISLFTFLFFPFFFFTFCFGKHFQYYME